MNSLNKHLYEDILDEMFRLRARVFVDRLGWDVNVEDGKEIDEYDSLDPHYVIGLNDNGEVVSCARALKTTGPHMLPDVFHAILDGEEPVVDERIWESTRFCVDTDKLCDTRGTNSVSYAMCELMIGSIEYASECGITDIVSVIDPIMNRVMKRANNAPAGYIGKTVPMGKVKAMAIIFECSQERINRIREYAGIDHDVFAANKDWFE